MDKKQVYLFQPQYAVGENTYWIPYSIGCLWSYAIQFEDIKNNFTLSNIFFKREDPELVLSKISNPSICAFSCYVWNEKYSLELAKKIKEKYPNCLIIFGGPQVNGRFLKYNFINSIVMAEGEENFVQALQILISEQNPILLYPKRRLDVLEVPSPYTTHIFDKIIKDNPDVKWSMTFETNRGCPYHCTFCDWGSLTYSKIKKFSIEKIKSELEWSIDKPINYVYCADANFGIFKERDLEIAKVIREVGNKANWDTVNLIYAKNSTEVVFQIAKILGDLNRGITISVQSLNDETLEAIKRKNLATNDIKYLMSMSEKYDIPTYTEVILGLPCETLDTWKKGLAEILELGQHNSIDLWFTQLIENSELNTRESKLKYGIKSIIAKDYMPLYNPSDYREISEVFELVNQTKSMTTLEMIEGYMFGWMIIQFHCTGYSQIIARYARENNISFYNYYNLFYKLLEKESVLGKHFKEIKDIVSKYLTTGEASLNKNNRGGHNIHALSYDYLYEKRELVYNLSIQAAKYFNIDNNVIFEIQKNFLYEEEKNYPIRIENYLIESKMSGPFNFYQTRRQGLFKNKITKNEI